MQIGITWLPFGKELLIAFLIIEGRESWKKEVEQGKHAKNWLSGGLCTRMPAP